MLKKFLLTTSLVLIAATAQAVETTRPEPKTPPVAKVESKGRMQVDLPKKWTSDNNAGAKQGVGIVFFPEGGSWSKSPAVMYVRTIEKVNNSAIRAIDADLAIYKEAAPEAKISDDSGLLTQDGKVAVVKKIKDEKSGNLEYISYIAEEKDVSVLTLNAKTEVEGKKAYPAYKELVNSYRFIKEGAAPAPVKAEENKAEPKKEAEKKEVKAEAKPAAKKEVVPAKKAETKPQVKAETKPKEETKK